MSGFEVRDLGAQPFRPVWAEMQHFTKQRDESTADEIWFVQHEPIFTLGLNSDRSHLLAPGAIDIVQTDRGGQVTYHGPGQCVCYLMYDLRRGGIGIRSLVQILESAVIDTMAACGVEAFARRDAPGVYVQGKKLAAVGLRVSRGCCYHGIAVNVDMDLEPFERIRPCGIEGLEVTQVSDLVGLIDLAEFQARFTTSLLSRFGNGDE